jgi:hypothetical protein
MQGFCAAGIKCHSTCMFGLNYYDEQVVAPSAAARCLCVLQLPA